MTHAARRRSAAQWAQLLASWNHTTTSATDFAARLGVSPGTLSWWRWKLRHNHQLVASGARLVPVHVEPHDDTPNDDIAWEFTSADGHSLRVHGEIDAASLALVLDRVVARRAR